jgi:hypothetical protein
MNNVDAMWCTGEHKNKAHWQVVQTVIDWLAEWHQLLL